MPSIQLLEGQCQYTDSFSDEITRKGKSKKMKINLKGKIYLSTWMKGREA